MPDRSAELPESSPQPASSARNTPTLRPTPAGPPRIPPVPAPAARPTPSAMRRALRRARDGVALDVTEATVLLHASGDDLIDLCASAARVRDARLATAGRPGVITYSK